jgi:hypothetical protein
MGITADHGGPMLRVEINLDSGGWRKLQVHPNSDIDVRVDLHDPAGGLP